MNKNIIILLALISAVFITSCSNNTNSSETKTEEQTDNTPKNNDLAHNAVKGHVKTQTIKSYNNVDVTDKGWEAKDTSTYSTTVIHYNQDGHNTAFDNHSTEKGKQSPIEKTTFDIEDNKLISGKVFGVDGKQLHNILYTYTDEKNYNYTVVNMNGKTIQKVITKLDDEYKTLITERVIYDESKRKPLYSLILKSYYSEDLLSRQEFTARADDSTTDVLGLVKYNVISKDKFGNPTETITITTGIQNNNSTTLNSYEYYE